MFLFRVYCGKEITLIPRTNIDVTGVPFAEIVQPTLSAEAVEGPPLPVNQSPSGPVPAVPSIKLQSPTPSVSGPSPKISVFGPPPEPQPSVASLPDVTKAEISELLKTLRDTRSLLNSDNNKVGLSK